MTLQVIKDRLTDKCESDPRLVLEYINEDRRDDLAAWAMTMACQPMSSDRFETARDLAQSAFTDAVSDYINDHAEDELAEYMTEMREEAAEMRAQAKMDERLEAYGDALMGAV